MIRLALGHLLASVAPLVAAAAATAAATAAAFCGVASDPGADASAPWLPAPRQVVLTQLAFDRQLAPLRRAQPRLLFVGDSITANWLTLGRAVWMHDFAPLRAGDLGFGGDRTENTLWRIDHGELSGIAPRVTVLEIGTNDLDRWTPVETARGVVAVARAITQRLPETRLVVLGVLPRDASPAGPLRIRAREVDALLAQTAFGPNVRYAEIGDVLLRADGVLAPGVMQDGTLHPSLAGYARLAPAIERLLPRDL